MARITRGEIRLGPGPSSSRSAAGSMTSLEDAEIGELPAQHVDGGVA